MGHTGVMQIGYMHTVLCLCSYKFVDQLTRNGTLYMLTSQNWLSFIFGTAYLTFQFCL